MPTSVESLLIDEVRSLLYFARKVKSHLCEVESGLGEESVVGAADVYDV